jgi:hypothetical protein
MGDNDFDCQVRQDAMAGNMSNIHSRPFYTGPLGYKMCVRLYPNGDGMGKGTHLSLFFTIMRSPHDALLAWPFKQKVKDWFLFICCCCCCCVVVGVFFVFFFLFFFVF